MKWIGVEYFCCNINICDNFEFLIFRNCRSEKDMSSITLYWCQSGVVGIHTDDCPFEGAHVSAVVDPGKFMNFNHDSVGRVYLVEENLNNNMQDSTPLHSSSGTSSSQVNSKKMYKEVILLTPHDFTQLLPNQIWQDGPSLESSSYLNVNLRYLGLFDPGDLGNHTWSDFNVILLRKVLWVVGGGDIAIIATSSRSRSLIRDLR